ncbi:unnamed protein product, partial [Ostreobium quekettii]
WLAGECRFGSRCNFAHGEHELRKLPPKSSPSRFSQDREPSDKDRGRGRPGGFFGSVSFDSGYRPMNARPSMYDYRSGGGGASYGGTYANGAGPYSRVYGATPNSGYGPVGRGSGPIHVAAAHSPNPPPRDFYAVHGYPVPGPNAWTMYRCSAVPTFLRSAAGVCGCKACCLKVTTRFITHQLAQCQPLEVDLTCCYLLCAQRP